MAMGYAFVGLADDVSGGLYNPAGLWVLEGPMISASFQLYSPADEFTYREEQILLTNVVPGVTKNSLDMSGVGHFSFVAPVRIKGHPWVFNFNYRRNNDYTIESLVRQVNPVLDYSIDNIRQEEGQLRTFNFGASTRIYKQFSMGFTLNIIDAERATGYGTDFMQEIVIDPTYGTTGLLTVDEEVIDSTKSNGFNFTLGMMYKEKKFSLGGVVHTPYTITHNSDRTLSTVVAVNELINLDNSETLYVVDSVAKQDIPLSFALGLALFPRENLTLTADMVYQNYGSTDWYYRTGTFFEPNGDRIDFYDEIPIDWNNTIGFGAGMEYRLNSSFGRIPLRLGVRFDELPQSAKTTNTYSTVGYDSEGVPFELDGMNITRQLEDGQSTTSFSVGTGLAWSQIQLDFAYMYTTGGELEIHEVYDSYAEDGDGNPLVITESGTAFYEQETHEFRFTFTGHF
jgi:long-subunit fatty acid transport protein